MSRNVRFVLPVLAALVAGAPAFAEDAGAAQRTQRPVQAADAWLLHLPGIAGETRIDRGLVRGLRDGGFNGDIHIYDWTGDAPGIPALRAHKRHQEEAAKVAQMITQQRRQSPNGRIVLTAHSGGTGIAVYALEMLPEDVKVDTVLLLSPALSPTYDLSKALPRVRGNVYSFPSPYDSAVLGIGTKLFGTVDGVKGEAAGKVGFVPPADADATTRKAYEKLIERPYDRSWIPLGNLGNHIGSMVPSFAAKVLTPLCLPEMPGVVVVPGRATTQPTPRPALK
jgi:pimeloyl-ACP methyl ester carboxylesterase